MPHDEDHENSTTNANGDVDETQSQKAPNPPPPAQRWSLFSIPSPLRQLFNKFPLVTYAANDLPARASGSRERHALYIFATEESAREGRPSYNPGCLKWQAYLNLMGVRFNCISSNNHASPSGALPFLLPATKTPASPAAEPVPSSKLQRWAKTQVEMGDRAETVDEPSDVHYEAYLSLLDLPIRRAWLYNLYLDPRNFMHVARPLYVVPTSSSSLVQLSIAHDLRRAALAELRKHSPVIVLDTLYAQAHATFGALETLLGQNSWFFGADKPGLFDASVFAYTHLLLDEGMKWTERDKLVAAVRGRSGLVGHRRRILEGWFARPEG